MFKPTLYLICGVPGSGKTTLANYLLESEAVDFIVATDDYLLVNGQYQWSLETSLAMHEECLKETEHAMKDPNFGGIAVHNTFTKNIYLNRYLDLAKKYGYNVVEIVMKSTFDCNKNTPIATIKRMQLQLQERLNDDWALT